MKDVNSSKHTKPVTGPHNQTKVMRVFERPNSKIKGVNRAISVCHISKLFMYEGNFFKMSSSQCAKICYNYCQSHVGVHN